MFTLTLSPKSYVELPWCRWSDHLPVASKVPSLILGKVHRNGGSNPVVMWKEYSQRSAESSGLSSSTPAFSRRESWQGGLGNTDPR